MAEEEWNAYKKQCSQFDFDVTLFVDSHLYLIVKPSEEARMTAVCYPLAFHARGGDHNDALQKEILLLQTESGEGLDSVIATLVDNEGISLGSHKFIGVARAYDLAEENAPGMKVADKIKNNCGDFVKSFGELLDVEVTPELTKQIARRLFEHDGGDLAEQIRASDKFDAWFAANMDKNVDEVDDEELIVGLVEMRTGDLYAG